VADLNEMVEQLTLTKEILEVKQHRARSRGCHLRPSCTRKFFSVSGVIVQGELEEAKGRVSELEKEILLLKARAPAPAVAFAADASAGGAEAQVAALQRQNGELVATLRKLRDVALMEKSALEARVTALDATLKVHVCSCACMRV
jgi:hypothetical protein